MAIFCPFHCLLKTSERSVLSLDRVYLPPQTTLFSGAFPKLLDLLILGRLAGSKSSSSWLLLSHAGVQGISPKHLRGYIRVRFSSRSW